MGSLAARVLHAIGDVPIGRDRKPIEREGRPRAIAEKPLAAFVVVGSDADGGVYVEALVPRGEAFGGLGVERSAAVVGVPRGVGVGQSSTEERDAGAGVERGFVGLVGAVLGLALVEQSLASQPAKRALVNAFGDALDGALRRRGSFAEADPLRGALECAVEDDDVKMDVEVQTSTKALNEGYGSAFGLRATLARARRAEDLFHEDRRQRGEHVGAERREPAKRERERQYPLSNGNVRNHSIGEMRGLVAHAPRAATRAESASLTRECNQQIVAARVAVAADEAVFELAAVEVLTKLVDDVLRQWRRVLGVDVLEEVVEVVADDCVEGCLLRAAGGVAYAETFRNVNVWRVPLGDGQMAAGTATPW